MWVEHGATVDTAAVVGSLLESALLHSSNRSATNAPQSRNPAIPRSRSSILGFLLIVMAALCIVAPSAFAQPGVHDWDGDGIDDPFQDVPKANHHQLKVWFSSAGPAEGRSADVLITERYADQTALFTRISVDSDLDGDGVREITTLGTINNPETSADVTVLSIYASTTGQPIMSFYGTGSDVLMSVFEGRATGNLVDELLLQIGEETEVTPGFVLDRLPALDPSSRDRNGIAKTYEWTHFQTTRIVLRLRLLTPQDWSWNVIKFKTITDIANRKSKDKYEDSGKRNALRHALWQFLLKCQFGEEIANDIGDIHEDYSKDPCDTAIDQFNNEAARQRVTSEACNDLASNPQSMEPLSDNLMQAIEDGVFVVSPDDPRVADKCQAPQ